MFNNMQFPKAKKYWYMGKFYGWDKSLIHPMSHALHYGTSVFEGIRAYSTARGSAIFRLKEHIDRFFQSASFLRMEVPYSREEIIEVIKSILKVNKLDSAYIRPLLFYSYGNLGLVPKFSPVQLAIAAWEWGAYLGEKTEKGVQVQILPWRRIHHSQTDMAAKLGGLYILSTIGGLLARQMGFDEAVYLNLEGNIAEGPGENIFIVKKEIIITNDRTESILEGITRASILEVVQKMGLKTLVKPITKQDFLEADEAFFTGTAVEVAPIIKVSDGSDPQEPPTSHTISAGETGEITRQIIHIYKDLVRGNNPAYGHWLTYVHDQ